MRKNLIPTALILMAAVGLAACAPGGGPAPSPSTTGPASASASSPGGTPSADTETTVPAPSPSAGAPTPGPGRGDAELAIMIKPSESAKAVNYTLVCRNGVPAAESKHPTAAAACAALKKNAALLSPGPRPTDQACTQQYGGPQKATVTGMVDGTAVDSEFSRTDGCEIAQWTAAKDVLVSSGGA